MKQKRMSPSFILILGVIIGLFCSSSCYSADGPELDEQIPDWLKRTDFGVEAGTDQRPRVYFETVQPLYQDLDKENTVFVQPRYSLKDDNSAYNLGLGYRRLSHDKDILLGANSFFDYERDDEHYRIGLGLESFINQIELRANSYIGLSPRRLVNETPTRKEYEKAVDGFDGEIGLPVPYMNWIKVYGAGYWYNYEEFKNKEGWWIRNEIKPFKNTTINLIAWDDNKGDSEFRVDARMSIPFGYIHGTETERFCNIGLSKKPYPEKIDHSDRTLDRVEREYKIEVEKWAVTNGVAVEIKRGN